MSKHEAVQDVHTYERLLLFFLKLFKHGESKANHLYSLRNSVRDPFPVFRSPNGYRSAMVCTHLQAPKCQHSKFLTVQETTKWSVTINALGSLAESTPTSIIRSPCGPFTWKESILSLFGTLSEADVLDAGSLLSPAYRFGSQYFSMYAAPTPSKLKRESFLCAYRRVIS